MKLRVGDEILVSVGKDKGRHGKIEKVYPKIDRILVPGLNVYKKHQKGVPGRKGGVIELSRSLAMGKVALMCPHCRKQTRVGMKILNTGEKVRVCRKCGRQIDEKVISNK